MISRNVNSPEGKRAITMAAHNGWLFAFDYDGTLAPFVTNTAAATIPPNVYADLAVLAARRTVAIITGRSREDILPRLPPTITYVIGNHGCEGPDSDPCQLASAISIVESWNRMLGKMVMGTSLRIEMKGPSLTLHWRGCVNSQDMANMARHFASYLFPKPHLIAGDHVLNLLPPGLPDKGTALMRVMEIAKCSGALFVGDDFTDAAVFRLRDPGILGIEVGDKGLGADWRVNDINSVAELLHDLVALTASSNAGG